MRLTFLLSFAVLLLCLFLLNSRQLYAEEVSLKITPPLLKIQAVGPADIHAPFSLENSGNEVVDININYKFFKDDGENGQLQYLKDHDQIDKELLKRVQIVDEESFAIDSFSLGPKQKKKLKLHILIPKDQPKRDYYFSVTFTTKPQQNRSETQSDQQDNKNTSFIQLGIALNILLTVDEKVKPQGYIEEFSTPLYREAGPIPFTVRIKNDGSQVINPTGRILITNMFGQTIGRLDLPQTNILAGSIRSIINTEATNGTQLIWPEKFLFGFYTANLSLTLSDEGPIYNRSIQFIAFPINILIGIIIALIILLVIYFRLKARLNENK